MKVNGFLILLILCGIFGIGVLVYVFSQAKPHKAVRVLPYYGIDTILIREQRSDTVWHQIPDFQFVHQWGQVLTNKDIEGKIWVADFFFTTCQSICKDMLVQKKRIIAAFPKEKRLVLLSHTVNPEKDTGPQLLEYAQENAVVLDSSWFFLTGDKKKLYEQARTGYMVTAEKGDGGPEDFIHTENLVLIDSDRHIRGYYDGTNAYEINQLMQDIDLLISELKTRN